MTDSYDRDLNPIESFSTDATKWAGKRVLKSVAHGFKLSTVWLSLDHQYGNGAPIVFETLIWDASGEEVGGTRHYSEEEAARWHLKALDAIRAGAVPDYVNDEWMRAAPTSPDLLDGGVTSALIEKEVAGSYTRTDEEGTDTRTREHLLAEEERLRKLEEPLRAHLSRTISRAEKAERELDAANARNSRQADLLAEQPRPLTADDITDEMVERAAHCLAMQQMPTTYSLEPDGTADKFYDDARDVLHAALTEPPACPEGAEELEAMVEESLSGDALSDAQVRALADFLAKRGVRVTGAES